MAKGNVTISVSLTETRQFRRLVEFFCEVSEYERRVSDDYDLYQLVEDCREDLMQCGLEEGE